MSLDNKKLILKLENNVNSLDEQLSELIKNSKIGFQVIYKLLSILNKNQKIKANFNYSFIFWNDT